MRFSVAANFIRCGKLKVGSREMLITQFTGNVHEFPAQVNKDKQDLSEDTDDDKRLEGTLLHIMLTYH